ncbi:hypothetical protein [Litorimonas sp. WD9-15]|uniref:hypothetical protein n=1 Tax=Litorimonas sp. WD9-15 TaxID=3418716 RepID=UPI003D08D8ED
MNGQNSFLAALFLVLYSAVIGLTCLIIAMSLLQLTTELRIELLALAPGFTLGFAAMGALFLWLRHCDKRS